MFSIYFLSKLFAISTIFIITLTSVSTESKVYQMIKIKEDYLTYLNRPVEPPEEKMSIKDVYLTRCNIEQRSIPTPSGKYDYKSYMKSSSNFCPRTYITFDVFERQYHIKLFNNAVLELKSCLRSFCTEKVRERIRNVFDATPNVADFSTKFMEIINKMKLCLNKMFVFVLEDHVDENMYTSNIEASSTLFAGCYDYKYKENENTMQQYANYIMEKLRPKLSIQDMDNFFPCLHKFKGKLNNIIPDIIPGKKGGLFHFKSTNNQQEYLTAKELLVAHSIIYNLEYPKNIIDVPKMFLVVFQLEELKINDKEITNCITQFKIMNTTSYTTTKLSYLLLPTLPLEDSDKKFSEYEIKMRTLINHLIAIDFKNKKFYSELLYINAQLKRKDFSKLIRRRAIDFETNYNSYVMRIMYLSEYLPLPRHLWNYERENSEDKNIQEFFSQEQKKDLESFKSSILIK